MEKKRTAKPPKKILPELVLGNQWPHRLLQLLPLSMKHDYLQRKSGGRKSGESFELIPVLQQARRFLIVWPERGEDILLAFPAMQALGGTLQGDLTGSKAGEYLFAHLVPSGLKPLLADLLPGEQILSWTREKLAWHDSSLQSVLASLSAFSPDISINLMGSSPPVLQALVKGSGAGLRIGIGLEGEAGSYVNLSLQADAASPLAARYFQILNPWRYAGIAFNEKWPSLQPGGDLRREAAEIWAESGVAPERTWLYLHDAADANHPLDDELHDLLSEKIRARESEKVALALATWNATDSPAALEGKWQNVPLLNATGLSEFMSLFGVSRGVAAFHGPALYAASLADVRCLALLRREEAEYDVSKWNPLFEVDWV